MIFTPFFFSEITVCEFRYMALREAWYEGETTSVTCGKTCFKLFPSSRLEPNNRRKTRWATGGIRREKKRPLLFPYQTLLVSRPLNRPQSPLSESLEPATYGTDLKPS